MSCKKYLTVKELEAALEDALDDLERDKQIDAVYIPPDVDSLTHEETIDDESSMNEDRFHGIDIAGTFEMHSPDFDSSDEETLASKRQGHRQRSRILIFLMSLIERESRVTHQTEKLLLRNLPA
ncbi:hypothetical protein JTB14_036309 [Gonioctena quinquepunctata]|nr:hypothetical protein JTB14_036309 [Gonioctena quinquepunctata]